MLQQKVDVVCRSPLPFPISSDDEDMFIAEGFDLLCYSVVVNDRPTFDVVLDHYLHHPKLFEGSSKTIFVALALYNECALELLKSKAFVAHSRAFKSGGNNVLHMATMYKRHEQLGAIFGVLASLDFQIAFELFTETCDGLRIYDQNEGEELGFDPSWSLVNSALETISDFIATTLKEPRFADLANTWYQFSTSCCDPSSPFEELVDVNEYFEKFEISPMKEKLMNYTLNHSFSQ